MPACMHRVTNGQLHEFINFVHVMLNEIKQTVFYNVCSSFKLDIFYSFMLRERKKNN